MGTRLASALIRDASITLLDLDRGKPRWPDGELLRWINAGQRLIALAKPDAYMVSRKVQLLPGTAQVLPTDGVVFRRVLRNKGLDGTVDGRAVRWADLFEMDRTHPEWHMDKPELDVIHWLANPDDFKRYFVWPPQPNPAGYVSVTFSAVPPNLLSVDTPIALDDIYAEPLVELMRYRALLKDSKAGDPSKAIAAGSMFYKLLGLKEKSEDMADPNKRGDPRGGTQGG